MVNNFNVFANKMHVSNLCGSGFVSSLCTAPQPILSPYPYTVRMEKALCAIE